MPSCVPSWFINASTVTAHFICNWKLLFKNHLALLLVLSSTVAFDEAWLFSSFRPSQKNFFFIAKKGKSGQGIIIFMSLFSWKNSGIFSAAAPPARWRSTWEFRVVSLEKWTFYSHIVNLDFTALHYILNCWKHSNSFKWKIDSDRQQLLLLHYCWTLGDTRQKWNSHDELFVEI